MGSRLIGRLQAGWRSRAWVAPLTAGLVLALVLVVAPPSRAADSVAFVDAKHGYRTTFEGDPSAGGRAVVSATDDGGETWRQLASGAPGYTSGGGFNSGLVAFASARVGLWGRYSARPLMRSTDGGSSWQKTALRPDGILWDFGFASTGVAWAVTGIGSDDDGGSIYKSTDGGAAWRVKARIRRSSGTRPPSGAFHRVSSPTARTCYVTSSGSRQRGLWVTTDGGAHWAQRRLPGGPSFAFDFPSATVGWNGAYDGSLYTTANGGRTWTRKVAPSGSPLRDASFLDERRGWIVGEDSTVLRTTDGGAHWTRLSPGLDADFWEVQFVDGRHGWITGQAGEWPSYWQVLLRTTDGGTTWEELP